MKKLFFIFGTRPEAIKLAPLIRKWDNKFVLNTGQHLDIMDLLDINIDKNLFSMRNKDGLYSVPKEAPAISNVIRKINPDCIVVQGDTSSAFLGALCGFYERIPVVHVEAGLRTYNKNAPYPEEFHRCAIDRMSDLMFAPTDSDRGNLLREGMDKDNIFVVGNTVVDELKRIIHNYNIKIEKTNKIVITLHRRESDQFLPFILHALKTVMRKHPGPTFEFILPMHPRNKKEVGMSLINEPNCRLVEPMNYLNFVKLMAKSYMIITDSGGIQEEAPTLHKPVVVVRSATERNILIEKGGGVMTGYDYENIISSIQKYIHNTDGIYDKAINIDNPFVTPLGSASDLIIKVLRERL